MTNQLTLETVLQKEAVTAILHSAENLAKLDGLPAPLQNVSVEGDIQIDDLSATVSADSTNLILEGIGDITVKSQTIALALQVSGQDTMMLSLAS